MCCCCKGNYRERFPFSSAGDEGEPLGLDGHAGALDMLLDIPEKEKNQNFVSFLNLFIKFIRNLTSYNKEWGRG